MQELKIFENTEFGEVRTVELDGRPYFAGTDVARALGYSNPWDAVTRHCKGIVKREGVSETTNQHGTTTKQITQMSFIPEGDVYRLIVSSKLPSAASCRQQSASSAGFSTRCFRLSGDTGSMRLMTLSRIRISAFGRCWR